MGKTFRDNDSHGNFRKYKDGRMKGKRKDKFLLPEENKDKQEWKRNDGLSREYDDIPNYYDDIHIR